jgi:hypothetical protein
MEPALEDYGMHRISMNQTRNKICPVPVRAQQAVISILLGSQALISIELWLDTLARPKLVLCRTIRLVLSGYSRDIPGLWRT